MINGFQKEQQVQRQEAERGRVTIELPVVTTLLLHVSYTQKQEWNHVLPTSVQIVIITSLLHEYEYLMMIMIIWWEGLSSVSMRERERQVKRFESKTWSPPKRRGFWSHFSISLPLPETHRLVKRWGSNWSDTKSLINWEMQSNPIFLLSPSCTSLFFPPFER